MSKNGTYPKRYDSGTYVLGVTKNHLIGFEVYSVWGNRQLPIAGKAKDPRGEPATSNSSSNITFNCIPNTITPRGEYSSHSLSKKLLCCRWSPLHRSTASHMQKTADHGVLRSDNLHTSLTAKALEHHRRENKEVAEQEDQGTYCDRVFLYDKEAALMISRQHCYSNKT